MSMYIMAPDKAMDVWYLLWTQE